MKITIDNMIEAMEILKTKSPLGGNTVVYICIPEEEYKEINLINMEADNDGAVALIHVEKQ